MTFPCVKCGACCRRYAKIVPSHIQETKARADGSCEHLQEDHSCAIYEERPWYCRVDMPGIDKSRVYPLTAAQCNVWIKEDGGTELVDLRRAAP